MIVVPSTCPACNATGRVGECSGGWLLCDACQFSWLADPARGGVIHPQVVPAPELIQFAEEFAPADTAAIGDQPAPPDLPGLLAVAGWTKLRITRPFGLGGAMNRAEPNDPDAVDVWVPPSQG